MPNGGIRLSIDLTSAVIAATADLHGTRIPVMLNGRIVMPHGLSVGPSGQLHVGAAAPSEPSADHQFIDDPLELLGAARNQPPLDAVQLLAGQLWHIADQAVRQTGVPVDALTVTIPSAWGPRRRGHLTDAATRASLPAPAMVTAPAALAAYATAGTVPNGSCLLVCQADRHRITLTVLQADPDGYRELATRPISLTHDLDHALAQQLTGTSTKDDDPPPAETTQSAQEHGAVALLESIRQARQLLTTQDRAPVLLPAPRQPAVITRDDVTAAAQPLLDAVDGAVQDILDAADVDRHHLANVIHHEAEAIPGLQERLAAATGHTPTSLIGHSHALADGALSLTTAHHHAQPTAADTQLPRVRLRIRDLTSAILIGGCSLALLLQAVFTADVVTVDYRVIGVRTSLPQLGVAGALAMITAFAVAHLAPTTWLAGTSTPTTPEPATGSLIRRGYLAAAAGGTIAAALYGLATGTAVEYDYQPYLKWTLGSALPLAACAAVIAATAPRIPAPQLPDWLARTRPAVLHTATAGIGIYLMQAALTLTPPVDLTGMPGLIGSAGAALLGIATALTASRSRTIRTVTAPGLAIGYAIVVTSNTSSALIIGYLVALTWWATHLAAHTLRLAYPNVRQTLGRLTGGPTA